MVGNNKHGHKFNPQHLNKLQYKERFEQEPFTELKKIIYNNGKISKISVNTIVDLGAGPGYFTFFFAHEIPENGKVYALDVSKEMIEVLNNNIKNGEIFRPIAPEDAKKIVAMRIKEDEFPLSNSSIDLFFSSKVLHEMEDTTRFIKELNRIMKPKGLIVSIDWKKEKTERGPPIEHRMSLNDAITIFPQSEFKILDTGDIFSNFYYIIAQKI